jgi:hypothetical protein
MSSSHKLTTPGGALYVTAVLCGNDHLPSAFVQLAHKHQIACVDVLLYNEEEYYGTYLMRGATREEQTPLLFVFPELEMVLVNDYSELVCVEERLEARPAPVPRKDRSTLVMA